LLYRQIEKKSRSSHQGAQERDNFYDDEEEELEFADDEVW